MKMNKSVDETDLANSIIFERNIPVNAQYEVQYDAI